MLFTLTSPHQFLHEKEERFVSKQGYNVPPAWLPLKGQVTEHNITIKWAFVLQNFLIILEIIN